MTLMFPSPGQHPRPHGEVEAVDPEQPGSTLRLTRRVTSLL